MIQEGWPEKGPLDHNLRPYWNFRDELTVNNGFIYKGQCTVIPEVIRKEILQNLHSNHMGAASNTHMAWYGERYH